MKIIHNILVIIGFCAIVYVAGSPSAVDAGHISVGRCFVQMIGGLAVFVGTMKAVKAI